MYHRMFREGGGFQTPRDQLSGPSLSLPLPAWPNSCLQDPQDRTMVAGGEVVSLLTRLFDHTASL